MYNVDEIVARLQNGDSLDAIGNELANLLNDANAKHLAIQKAEEEKRAAEAEKARQSQIKAQRTATRRELLWDVLEAIRNYAGYTDYAAIVNKWLTEATDDDSGVELCRTEDGGSEGRGGGFAMRTRHGNAGAQAHEFGQHLGAGDDGDAAFVGGHDFRVGIGNSGRAHHDLGVAEVVGGMAGVDERAEAAQALDSSAGGDVGAVHGVAEVQEHFGDAAHARAADAYHMDDADLVIHGISKFSCCWRV